MSRGPTQEGAEVTAERDDRGEFPRLSESATDLPSEEENDLQKFLKTEARIIVDEMQSEWGRGFAKAEVKVTDLINRKQKDEQKKELLRQMTQINAWANKVFLKPIEDNIASIKASIPRSRVIADDYRDRKLTPDLLLELHQFVSEKKLEGEARTAMVIRMLVFDIASQVVFKSSDAVGINIANKIFSEIPEEAEAVKVGIKTNARDRSEEASLREKEIKKEVKLLVKDEKIVSDVKVNLASVQDTREWRAVRAIVATKVAGQMVHPRVMTLRRER